MPDGEAGQPELRQLLDAIVSIGSELDVLVVLRRIILAATDLVQASYGALGVLDESGTRLADFLTVGVSDEQVRRIGPLPKGHGILGLLIVDPEPLRLEDLRQHPDSFGFPPHHPVMRSFLGVPIRLRDRVFGNLYLANKRDAEGFTEVDEELVVALATAAGVAIENTRLHTRLAEVALLEDRERIARDLHDTVIQRLFATGLALQGATRRAADPMVAERIERAVGDIDAVIRDIRTTIFELQGPRSIGSGLRRQVLDVCHEASRTLGYDPVVRFSGPVDTLAGHEMETQVVHMLREALGNVAGHVHGSRVEVDLVVADDHGSMTIDVADDGVGFDAEAVRVGYGLDNMRARAHGLGGSMTVDSGRGGTSVRILLPLPDLGSGEAEQPPSGERPQPSGSADGVEGPFAG